MALDRFERLAVLLITASLVTGALVRLPQTTDFVTEVGRLTLNLVRTFSGTSKSQQVV